MTGPPHDEGPHDRETTLLSRRSVSSQLRTCAWRGKVRSERAPGIATRGRPRVGGREMVLRGLELNLSGAVGALFPGASTFT